MVFYWMLICGVTATITAHLDDISYYEIVTPHHVGHHARNKRDLSTKNYMGGHFDATAFEVYAHGRYFHMNLQRNNILLPNSYVNILQRLDGSEYITNGEVENCYYHGSLVNRTDSMISISTCGGGLRGLIMDNVERFYIEPLGANNDHVIYNMKDLTSTGVCGTNHSILSKMTSSFPRHSRLQRSISNKRYIEVAVVMDNREYKKHGKGGSEKRALEIMNHVDAVYKTLGTRVAVATVIVWNYNDKISISTSPSSTLNQFKVYYKNTILGTLKLQIDNAQLITGIDFDGTVVGLAPIGVMCGWDSCAVNQDHGNAGKTANTVAHEMGHNTGMAHDTSSCTCSKEPCVMTASAAATPAKGFSDCSTKVFDKREREGDMPCIYDYPDKLFGKPKCGNGYIEDGETCDCGTEEECKATGGERCCNPTTCMIHDHAKCASGPCCDLTTCGYKEMGILCRDKLNFDCDLQEYCLGNSSECVRNYYVKDGTPCDDDEAYCYEGICRSGNKQCVELWGTNAKRAPLSCYKENMIPSKYGSCGKDKSGNLKACSKKNMVCGTLQCTRKSSSQSFPRFPIVGSGSGGKVAGECRYAYTNVGPYMTDPTETLEGSKCHENSLCINKVCTNMSKLTYIKLCTMKCLNGGVCNNNGNCHCPPGFACPNCEFAGIGGSLDSGQGCTTQTESGCLTPLVKALLVVFLLVIPLIALTVFLIYKYRDRLKVAWNDCKKGGFKNRVERSHIATKSPAVVGAKKSPAVVVASGTTNKAYSPNMRSPVTSPNTHSSNHETSSKLHFPKSFTPSSTGRSPKSLKPKMERVHHHKSPAPRNKLPQISAFNKMDADAGNIHTIHK